MYAHGRGVTEDPARAVGLHRSAAEAGNVDAQFNLATMSPSSTGVPKNLTIAAQWFSKAADSGDVMYDDGLGVPKDPLQADHRS
jgi:hypothetical protein